MTQADEAVTQIDRIASETIVVPVVGTAPLIVHRFSEKAKRKMLDAMQGRKSPKEPKDPQAEFKAAAYRLNPWCGTDPGNSGVITGDRYGFPAIGFKAATVGAARYYPRGSVTMTGLRQFMFFHGELGADGQKMVEILPPEGDENGDWPRMREDVVKVNRGGSDLRYRPDFWPWRANLRVTYVKSALTRSSVLSLIDAGGLGVGIGEWRPERGGDFGTYAIDVDREVEVLEEYEGRRVFSATRPE